MQDFTPERQALHYIDILPCVVMGETRAGTPTPNSKAIRTLFVPHLRRVEILLQVADHAIARVAIRPQECMVVAYAVQRLAHRLLREPRLPAVPGGERLDRAFFGTDVALDLPPAPLLSDDLLRGGSDERVAQQVERPVYIEQFVHRPDRRDAGEPEHFADLWGLAVLQKSIIAHVVHAVL